MIYVMSDIHGQRDLFLKMLKTIDFSDGDEMYILGDIVDRGPCGLKLLLKIMKIPNMHVLMGNHELMMYRYLTETDCFTKYRYGSLWFANGGKITLAQFGSYAESTHKRILRYIEKLPSEYRVNVNGREYILCHAIPHPSSFKINPFENTSEGYRYSSEEEMAAWEREIRVDDKNFENKIIIHGHTPTKYRGKDGKFMIKPMDKKGFIADINNAFEINIDCGAAYIPYGEPEGRLCCLRLDDMKEFYIE